jgi:hypothetical protein
VSGNPTEAKISFWNTAPLEAASTLWLDPILVPERWGDAAAGHCRHWRISGARYHGLPAFLLALFTGPIYVAAGVMALLRRPLTYAVTAKGKLSSVDSLRGFRLHLLWAAVAGAC